MHMCREGHASTGLQMERALVWELYCWKGILCKVPGPLSLVLLEHAGRAPLWPRPGAYDIAPAGLAGYAVVKEHVAPISVHCVEGHQL